MGKKLKNPRPDMKAEEREKQELDAADRIEKLKSWLKFDGHKKPTSRRDFLASGALGFSGFIAAPSILELVLRSVHASAQSSSECAVSSVTSDLIPVVTVNLSGGAAMMANFVPHDINRNLLPTYSVLGLGSTSAFQVVREFGNTPFPATTDDPNVLISKFLEGLKDTAGPTAIDKTAFVAVCVRSQDDSRNNKSNITGLVNAAGLKGSDLPIMGTRNTITGVGQMPALTTPPAPLIVNRLDDVTGAITAGGILAQQLTTTDRRVSLARTIASLNASQKQTLARSSSADTLSKLVTCASEKNVVLAAKGSAGIDPRQDPNVAEVWGIAPNTGTNNRQVVFASLVYTALNGKAGAVGLDLGGYDYHGQNRTTSDGRDRDAGTVVGRILKTAEVMNKAVFIHVTSDGAVSSQKSDNAGANFTGDRGTGGASYIIAYNPAGRPATNDFQIGHVTSGQAADDQFIPTWNAERAAMAVFANYLQLNNKLEMLDTLTENAFDLTQKRKILRFG